MAEDHESPTPHQAPGDAGSPSLRAARRGWRRGGRAWVTVAVALGALVVGGAGLGLALGAGASTPEGAAPGCGSSQPRLTEQGTGQAQGTPDQLSAVFGFSTTASSSAAALSQDNGEVNEALLALAHNGVPKSDVQTTALTLAPQYSYPHGVQTLTGYQATNTVTATLRDVGTAGTAVDAAVGATGDAATINALTFSFADPARVEDQARTQAVHQAVSHAAAMAAAAGRRLGPVCALTDNTQPSLYAPEAGSAFGASNGPAASVPVEPGSQTETDQVTMVYALASV
jgi:uncharacterized protein YggE